MGLLSLERSGVRLARLGLASGLAGGRKLDLLPLTGLVDKGGGERFAEGKLNWVVVGCGVGDLAGLSLVLCRRLSSLCCPGSILQKMFFKIFIFFEF